MGSGTLTAITPANADPLAKTIPSVMAARVTMFFIIICKTKNQFVDYAINFELISSCGEQLPLPQPDQHRKPRRSSAPAHF